MLPPAGERRSPTTLSRRSGQGISWPAATRISRGIRWVAADEIQAGGERGQLREAPRRRRPRICSGFACRALGGGETRRREGESGGDAIGSPPSRQGRRRHGSQHRIIEASICISGSCICRFRLCDDHDARAMLPVLEFFFFVVVQGIGSRSAAWASRVDVV
ncbi:hypothetical protein ACQJBY_030984 [Aegilops geniculata]